MPDILPHSIGGSSSLINQRSGYDPEEKLLRHTMYARVLKINWQSRTVNCIGLHKYRGNGEFKNVPILAPVITQTEGLHWLPDISTPSGDSVQSNSKLEGEDDALAILLFVGNNQDNPVCIGFIAPGANQFSFAEEGTRIDRHTSDIYNRITKDGTYELSFPDGTYVKVTQPENGYDLTDLSLIAHRDKRTKPWTVTPDNPRIIIVKHPSGTSLSINETGSITIYTSENININATDGSIVVNNIDLVDHVHEYKNNNNNIDYTSQPRNP